ncbi:hypothetical protein JCM10207_007551 [Rhodosporidiobolus poonsookiae]
MSTDSKLIVKATIGQGHPRRLSFPLAVQLAAAFSLKPGSFRIAYQDDDNDLISVSSSSDLLECIDYFGSESPEPSASSTYSSSSASSSASTSSWLSFTSGSSSTSRRNVTIRLDLVVDYDGPALSEAGSSVYGGGGGSEYGAFSLRSSSRSSSSSFRAGSNASRPRPPSSSTGSSSWLREHFWPSNSTSSGALDSGTEEEDSDSQDEWERETVSSVSQLYEGRVPERGRGRAAGGERDAWRPQPVEYERHGADERDRHLAFPPSHHAPYPYSPQHWPPPPPHHHHHHPPPPFSSYPFPPSFPFPFSSPYGFPFPFGAPPPPPPPASLSRPPSFLLRPASLKSPASGSTLALPSRDASSPRDSGSTADLLAPSVRGGLGKDEEDEEAEEDGDGASCYTVTDPDADSGSSSSGSGGTTSGVSSVAGDGDVRADEKTVDGEEASLPVCVGCEKALDGQVRFACVVCEDWEICVECERSPPDTLAHHDAQHILLKLPASSSSPTSTDSASSLVAAKAHAASLSLRIPSSASATSASRASGSSEGGSTSSSASQTQAQTQAQEAYDAYSRAWWEWYAALAQIPPPPPPPPRAHAHAAPYPPAASPAPSMSLSPYGYLAASHSAPSLLPPAHPHNPSLHSPYYPAPPSRLTSPFSTPHHGVTCASCALLIAGPSPSPSLSSSHTLDPDELGVRYLCANCPTAPRSYDLCARCEPHSEEMHDPSHAFLRITHPLRRPLPGVRALLPVLYRRDRDEGAAAAANAEGDLMDLRSETGGRRASSGGSSGSGSGSGRSSRSSGRVGRDEVMHPNVICDGCSQPIQGAWLRCCHCPASYDLCERCLALSPYTSAPHPPHHVFIKLKRPVDLPLLREITRLRTRTPRALIEFDLYA